MGWGEFGMLHVSFVALAGGCVGFLSGVFGIGGGFLIVPVLNIALRIPMEDAVGAGACQVLGPATTSLLARRVSREHFRLPVTICGGLFVGVFCGASLLRIAGSHADVVVLVTYFTILLGVGVFALWEVHSSEAGRELKSGWLAGCRIPPYGRFAGFDRPRVSIPVLSCVGVVVGFVAGLLGMSGGLILLPGFIYLLGMKTHQAVMSSLVIVWLVSLQATVVHAWHENIDLTLVTALLLGGTVGARLGSELSEKLGGRQLRKSFGWLLIVSAAIIGGRLVGMMRG